MRVEVSNRFPATQRKFEKAWLRAADRAARDGVRAAKGAQTRYRIRGILARTRAQKARVEGTKIVAGIVNPDWKEIFFEFGTLTRRRRPLKRPRRRQVTRGGIHPQYPLTKARKLAIGKLREYTVTEGRKVR